jgi:maleamate amidohydrolase
MTSLFKQSGYDEDTRMGFGQRPAVVVVDFQRAFTDPRFPLAKSAHVQRAVDNTAILLKAARAAGAPVAHSYTAYASEREAPHWKVKVVTERFRHGWEGCELDPRTYDPTYDAVYCKAAPSIFFGTSVASFFAKEQVDTVFVTGCTTSGCVRASVIDAFSHGFRVMVPEPCSGDQEEEAHKANLLDVARRYADVLTLEESLAYFGAVAAARA